MDIVDRMFELVDVIYKEQQQFAKAIGVPAPRVSEWRKRKSASYSKKEMLPKIAEVLNTTTEYLLTGEGPKQKSSQAPAPKGDGLTAEFAKLFQKLTPENQNEIIAEMLRRQPDK